MITESSLQFPAVSVLMPTYNNARHIRDAVDSILVQTFTDFELVIVIDGATDNSEEILREYTDSRIRILPLPQNMGRPYARNTALQAAQGKYIVWMDADDISLPRRLEKQVAFMDAHPDVAVCGGAIQCFHKEDACVIFPFRSEAVTAGLFFSPTIANPASCSRRDIILRYGVSYDAALPRAEDYDFWRQLLLVHKQKGANIPDVLLLYRVENLLNSAGHIEVQRRILAQLGLEPTEEMLGLCLLLSVGEGEWQKFSPSASKAFIQQALAANAQKRIFPQNRIQSRLYTSLAKHIIRTTPGMVNRLLACIHHMGGVVFLQTGMAYTLRWLTKKTLAHLQRWLYG